MNKQLQFGSLEELELLAQYSSLREDSYYFHSLLKKEENENKQKTEEQAILV